MQESIDRFVHGGILVLHEETTAQQAARAMYERRVGSVVVSNHAGKVTGLLTDRDLSTQVLAFGYAADTPISEFMTSDIQTVQEDAQIKDVLKIMEENGVRRVPVIRKTASHKEKCVGMVTLDDLIAERAINIEVLSRIVGQQVQHPSHLAHGELKRESRTENTLNRFYNLIAEKTGLPRADAEGVSYFLLSALVQRLPYTGAAQLISHLPKILQEDLLSLRAGPNREITTDALLEGLSTRFALTSSDAMQVLERFWEAISQFTSMNQIRHSSPERVSARTQTQIRELFVM